MRKRWAIARSAWPLAIALFLANGATARAQGFRYESKPKVDRPALSYASSDPAPLLTRAPEPPQLEPIAHGGIDRPRRPARPVNRSAYFQQPPASSRRKTNQRPMRSTALEQIPQGRQVNPFVEDLPAPGRGEYIETPRSDSYFDAAPSMDGEYWSDGYGDGECDDCCCECDECCDGYCDSWLSFCPCLQEFCRNRGLTRRACWENFSTWSGAHAFKGPPDRGVNGNFGFNKGVNWAKPLCDASGIGMQLGTNIAFSDFEGGSGIVNDQRYQFFFTGGLFRRAECGQGWQGGAVADYLYDHFYVHMSLVQLRAELSYLWNQNELGFWGAASLNSDTAVPPPAFNQSSVTWQANNQYNLFYRCNFAGGGYSRMWIGTTNYLDVNFGADALAPLSENWALQGAYNYLLPGPGGSSPRDVRESFGVSLAVVWFPGYKNACSYHNPYRPLFPVADNSWMFLREKSSPTQSNDGPSTQPEE